MIQAFVAVAASCFWVTVFSQTGVTDCALRCIADVSGTTCAQTQWPCLCPSPTYIESLNACVYQACTDIESQQATFGAIANICNVFGFSPTASAEIIAASTMDLAGTVSILGVPSPSMMPVASSTLTSELAVATGVNTTLPVTSGTLNSELAIVTGVNKPNTTPNVTTTSASDLLTTGSTQSTSISELEGSTQLPSSTSPMTTMGTPLGTASRFRFSRYAMCGPGLVAAWGAWFC